MHLLIPFAFSTSEGCKNALPTLRLPHLQQLLDQLNPLPADHGEASSLSPPHERALAHQLGLSVVDGQIPWAAHRASQYPELAGMGGAWGFITLCHWQVNTNHVAMSTLPLPHLTIEESNQLLSAMRPYFAEDSINLFADQPGRWLAHSEVFAGLATASPDRAMGRNLDTWMPRTAQAAPLRRLQNEMQMLLYTHSVNDAREARGVLPINSFWLNGTGVLSLAPVRRDDVDSFSTIPTLREAALTENWNAWVGAWHALDAGPVADLLAAHQHGEPVMLTLCGETNAQTWVPMRRSLLQRIKHRFASRPSISLIETL